jgi:uncharacterized protein (DUF2252 family)
MGSLFERIRDEGPERRRQFIVDTFISAYPDLMRADPEAWRGKFRKMAGSAFAYYRGSAAGFYADMADETDAFTNEKTGRVWIQGDLHAANFGTYMNSAGVLVFDVNDFDEAYVGPFMWDLKRLAASLTLIGYEKALSDAEIAILHETLATSYAEQVAAFATGRAHSEFALTLGNTDGKLLDILRSTRLLTHLGVLQALTTVENYERRFSVDASTRILDAASRRTIEDAFERYLETIPARKRFRQSSYNIKDIVGRRGIGIGSAGRPAFAILVEGPTQALENDRIIYMKQSIPAAPSRVITDPTIRSYFAHDGHRTVVSQRALQAYADPWLGYTEVGGAGQLVAETSPFVTDLDWSDIGEMSEIVPLVRYLGQAVSKIHSVSDIDSDQTLVPFSTDEAIHAAITGREADFVREIREFGQDYGAVVREDHELFLDAFRNGLFANL